MFILNFLLKLVNYLILLGLLLALIAPYVEPSVFWPVAFLGLAHPILLLLNILFLLYWAFRKKIRFVFNLAVLVLSIGSINKIWTFGAETSPDRTDKIKVISFNAKLFGAYAENNYFDQFLNKVSEKNPDILCIQEFFNMDLKGSNPVNEIKKKTGLRYHYFRHLKHKKHKSRFGIILFSRYKIVDYGDLDFGKNSVNLCLYTDLKVNEKVIRVYNVHLQSLKLARTDYELLKNIGEDKDSTIRVSMNIFERLKMAFIKRGEQADMLKESMRASGKPVILCGDFNDTPQSYAYQTLMSGLKDSFLESGDGLGGTYVGPLPSLRIDYILHDPSMSSFNYLASKTFESDHKMLETLIALH